MSDNIERFQIYGAVYVLLIKNEKIFLLRRANTGWQDGKYNLPAGHIEAGEKATDAAAREALEEAGVEVNPSDLGLVHVMYRLNPEKDRVYADYFFVPNTYQGEPSLRETDKADAADWFAIAELPAETIEYLKVAIENYQKGIIFSEFGWE